MLESTKNPLERIFEDNYLEREVDPQGYLRRHLGLEDFNKAVKNLNRESKTALINTFVENQKQYNPGLRTDPNQVFKLYNQLLKYSKLGIIGLILHKYVDFLPPNFD